MGENETSFTIHIDWLISEAHKSSPEGGLIDEMMALTWRQRVSYVASASVREAKIKHPYIMEPCVSATPCVVFSRGERIQEVDYLHVQLDRAKLFSVKNAQEDLAAVVSAYWIFNCQYESKEFL
ncbi:hypothetical protein HPB51_000529 [Rhipicephalus microplus]|uniref:Uncharacterized protein n=1 Tax=Rhipicephalus microplus TaxID=6941 RepID=A0A9J6D3N6_RHIMP|nr:hypothetical protein HPB51_000529 [Rhipicephalus microplus]